MRGGLFGFGAKVLYKDPNGLFTIEDSGVFSDTILGATIRKKLFTGELTEMPNLKQSMMSGDFARIFKQKDGKLVKYDAMLDKNGKYLTAKIIFGDINMTDEENLEVLRNAIDYIREKSTTPGSMGNGSMNNGPMNQGPGY